MAEDLKKLRELINTAIDSILEVCERRDEDFPRLDEPAGASEFSPDGIRNDPAVADAITLGVSAASQLIATLQSPTASITAWCGKALVAANIAAVERIHVAEILRDAGDKGLHVTDIVKHNGTDQDKLARVLRHLATYHVFREVTPDVFAHNLVSSVLDTGKLIEEIKADPDSKYENTNGFAAWASMLTDDCLKNAFYIDQSLSDPYFAHSQEPTQCTFQKALDVNDTWWGRLQRPENVRVSRRFNASMRGSSAIHPPAAMLTLYEWAALPPGAVIVDVGSGLGHVCLEVSKIRSDLTFVLEDMPAVIDNAKAFLATNAPGLAGNVHYLATDYLKPQPELPAAPDVILIRLVVHNMSDKYAAQLLANVRQVAKPETKLLIMDSVVEYACVVPDEPLFHVAGYKPSSAPAPLLTNFGPAQALAYDLDMMMLNNFNGKERTIKDWHQLFDLSGWKLTNVHKSVTNRAWWPLLVAEPV